ncbi:hypothetical protein BRARA_B01926 [Brassica rapa]|uniref:SKP1 component dimerisation domain-containing protein n=1 Tax=Brassica campestris TaxID=3711 RepID=A0A398ADB3_BRACM|nr:hypothetical protein BRARA_B01926 [Brassica rapa]
MKEVKDKEKAIDDEWDKANTSEKDIYGNTEDTELKNWDSEFVKAANYLSITGLLNPTCKTVADMMIGKTPEEMRTHFNINNNMGL